MESTRSEAGLHQSDVVFYVKDDGVVVMLGDISDDHQWSPYLDNATEL